MSALAAGNVRAVERVVAGQLAPVGTFSVRRALPSPGRNAVGPWVFLDHWGPMQVTPGQDGVGAHPHAGIETVTYLLSGRQRHRDSAGHEGIVTAGGVQWMTAGRGVIHAEQSLAETEAERTSHGIQLWTSLPRQAKLTEPDYQRIEAAQIPARALAGGTLRVIAGELAGIDGPARTRMPLVLAHLTLDPAASLRLATPEAFEMGAYVISGAARVGADDAGETVRGGELAIFAGLEGEVALANAAAQPVEVLLLGGAPAEGPLVFHGPFVMNSLDQVRAAEVAYRTGRMGTLAP